MNKTSERGFFVAEPDDGTELHPGEAEATIQLLTRRSKLIAEVKNEPIELTGSYPNGKACDKVPYVFGSVRLTEDDLKRDLQ